MIRDVFLTEKLPWHYNDRVVSTERHFMFTHAFMDNGRVINPHFFEPVRAMLGLIQEKKRFIGVTRIKANLYTNQGRIIEHPAHHDIPPGADVSGISAFVLFAITSQRASFTCPRRMRTDQRPTSREAPDITSAPA